MVENLIDIHIQKDNTMYFIPQLAVVLTMKQLADSPLSAYNAHTVLMMNAESAVDCTTGKILKGRQS